MTVELFRSRLGQGVVHQAFAEALPAHLGMHRDVQDVAFIGDQPAAEETDQAGVVAGTGGGGAVGHRGGSAGDGFGGGAGGGQGGSPGRDDEPGKRQQKLAFEGVEAPRIIEGEAFDFEDAGRSRGVASRIFIGVGGKSFRVTEISF